MRKDKKNAGSKGNLKRWETLSSKELLAVSPWVNVYRDKIKLPNGRIVDDYYRIQMPEFVMVYAQRGDGKVLFERQYKHALGDITLALPTGCLEDGELPIEAGKRELLEETGYIASKWRHIGSFMVDGNKGCGKAHFYTAQELEKIAEPVENDMEESEIVFIEPEIILKTIRSGEISLLATAALAAIASHPHIFNKSR